MVGFLILSLICIKFRQNSERRSQYSTSVECKMNLALMLGEPFPGFQGGVRVKESACQCRRCRRHRFDPWVRKIPWQRKWQLISVFLPGKLPWTEEPGRLQSTVSQIQTRLHMHTLSTLGHCPSYRTVL